jgi:hypothetical protein
MNFIYAILTVYGFTLILTQGSIFKPSKDWLSELPINNKFLSIARDYFLKLFQCSLCCSFWISLLIGPLFNVLPLYNVLMYSGLFSGTTYLLNCLTGFLGNTYDPNRIHTIIISEPIKIEGIDNINTKGSQRVVLRG